MALIKEPYGLVYNTDGSLCVTYRDDDIPFAGVRSFGIFESTHNYIEDGDFSDFPSCNGYSKVTNNSITMQDYVENAKLLTIGQADNIYVQNQLLSDPNYNGEWMIGDTYTASVKVKILDVGIAPEKGIAGLQLGISNQTDLVFADPNNTNWQTLQLTRTPTGPIDMRLTFWSGGAKVAVKEFQLEKKAFRTPFCLEDRPTGVVDFNLTSNENNFVINAWRKYTKPVTDAQHSISWQDSSADFRFDDFVYPSTNIQRFTIYIDGTVVKSLTLYPNANLMDWHMFTLIYDDGYWEIKINDQTLTSFNKTFPYDQLRKIRLGARVDKSNSYCMNGYIANFFVGKYRKPDGSIKWTDDYIREVYEAHIPFAVSNKLSIY